MKRLIFVVVLFAVSSAFGQAIPIDVVYQFNRRAPGSIANASNMGGVTYGNYYQWDAGTITRFSLVASNAALSFPVPVTISNTTVSSTGTNWLWNNMTSGSEEIMTMELPGSCASAIPDALIAGYVVYYQTNNTGFATDLEHWTTCYGGYWTISQEYPTTTNVGINIESQNSGGSSVFGTKFNITTGKVYFRVFARRETKSLGILKYYDPTTTPFTLVGSVQASIGYSNTYAFQFDSGYIGNSPGGMSYSDQFIIYNPTDAQIDGIVTNNPCISPLVSTNAMTWGTAYCGVSGGIPTRSTIYTNFYSTNTTAEINTGIANCPSNQVVKLNAGAYNFTNSGIQFKSYRGVSLRGDGMGQTVLNFWSMGGGNMIYADSLSWSGWQSISSGYTQGSSNFVVASTAGFKPGNMCLINQTDDTNLVYSDSSSTSNLQFTFMVTATNATTVTVWPPLPYGLQSWYNPKIAYLSGNGATMDGLESLSVKSGDGTGNANIYFYTVNNCWLTNVESVNANYHSLWTYSVNNSIQRCYFHVASTTEGQGVYLYNGSCFNVVENNQADNGFAIVMLTGASGNAILFNFATNMYQPGFAYQDGSFNANHGAHPMMNLFEGNVGPQFQSDGYHGSSSHTTLFRNWFHGLHGLYSGNRKMVDLDRATYWYQLIGNVLGWSSWTNASTVYAMSGSPSYTAQPTMYRFGYPNMGNNSLQNGAGVLGNGYTNKYPEGSASYPDTNVLFTVNSSYNFDFATSTNVTACAGVPNSYFYNAAPSYWGSCPWPAFDPTTPLLASQANIPAGLNYPYVVSSPIPNAIIGNGTLKVTNGKLIFQQ